MNNGTRQKHNECPNSTKIKQQLRNTVKAFTCDWRTYQWDQVLSCAINEQWKSMFIKKEKTHVWFGLTAAIMACERRRTKACMLMQIKAAYQGQRDLTRFFLSDRFGITELIGDRFKLRS